MYYSTFNITALAPFDFDLSSRIFSEGAKQIRKYENNHFWQALRTKEDTVLLMVESVGEVEKPELQVRIESPQEMSPEALNSIPPLVHKMFNLSLDLNPFYNEVKEDKVLNSIIKQLYGLKNPTTPTLFEALLDSIVEQQISLKAAHTIENRLIKGFGSSVKMYGKTYHAYPTPEELSTLELQQLRDCGLSFRKAEYIRDLSLNIVNQELDLESLGKMKNTTDIVEQLCEIRGIGIWTAELSALRGLGRLDAIPADDVSLQRIISHYYRDDEKINAEEAREIAKKWGKWAGLAAYYLVVADLMSL